MVQQVRLERENKMIGKWNKSELLTYIGLSIAIVGIVLVLCAKDIKYTMVCFMFSGICDLFDGTFARRFKRTKEEKSFGIELDSLVDVISFVALPLVILGSINKRLIFIPIYLIYAIFAIARLAFFNIDTADKDKAISYYIGLPVTFAALIFPVVFLLNYFIDHTIFILIYNIVTILVAILYILKIKVPKPKLKISISLIFLAIVMTVLYLIVL